MASEESTLKNKYCERKIGVDCYALGVSVIQIKCFIGLIIQLF